VNLSAAPGASNGWLFGLVVMHQTDYATGTATSVPLCEITGSQTTCSGELSTTVLDSDMLAFNASAANSPNATKASWSVSCAAQ
jgi:hypothetical protein